LEAVSALGLELVLELYLAAVAVCRSHRAPIAAAGVTQIDAVDDLVAPLGTGAVHVGHAYDSMKHVPLVA